MTATWIQDGFRFFDKDRNGLISGEEVPGALHVSSAAKGATLQEVSDHFERLERSCPGLADSARDTVQTAIEARTHYAQVHNRYLDAKNSTYRPDALSTAMLGVGAAGGVALLVAAYIAGLATPLGIVLLICVAIPGALAVIGVNRGMHEEEVPAPLRDEDQRAETEAERTGEEAKRQWERMMRAAESNACLSAAFRPA